MRCFLSILKGHPDKTGCNVVTEEWIIRTVGVLDGYWSRRLPFDLDTTLPGTTPGFGRGIADIELVATLDRCQSRSDIVVQELGC